MYGVFDLMHLSPNFYVMSTLLLKQKQNGLCRSKQSVLNIDSPDTPSKVVIFNSHARKRTELVTIKISLPNVRVYKVNKPLILVNKCKQTADFSK